MVKSLTHKLWAQFWKKCTQLCLDKSVSVYLYYYFLVLDDGKCNSMTFTTVGVMMSLLSGLMIWWHLNPTCIKGWTPKWSICSICGRNNCIMFYYRQPKVQTFCQLSTRCSMHCINNNLCCWSNKLWHQITFNFFMLEFRWNIHLQSKSHQSIWI